MRNNEIKILITKYLKLDFNDFFILNDNITAYIPSALKDGDLLYEQIYANCVVIFVDKPGDETVLFNVNETSWYIGCLVDKNNNRFKHSELKDIFNSKNFLRNIKNKEHVGGVRGYECYDTLEELLIGF